MARAKKQEIPPSEALYPVPVVLVSCLDRDRKRANAITIAWCGVACSNPPLITISIRPSRHSHALILKEREFVVNIPSTAILAETDLCGVTSGRQIDKFSECSFTSIPASKISAPMIEECPVNIECTLQEVVKLGSHDMFIGKVVAVHADKEILDDSGALDFSKARPFVYNRGEYWSLGSKIGFYGCSKK